MREPRLRLVLGALVLTALTLIALDARSGAGSPASALRRGADAVFGPTVRAVGGTARTVAGALSGLPRLGSYRADNVRLERENAVLRARLRDTDALRRSQAELDRLLALRAVGTYDVVPARIVALGSSLGFERTATLDAGSRDGITSGQTVLASDGLVGRTTRVGPFTSTVLLLVDRGSTVGGRLQRLGGVGLVTGTGGGLRYELVDAAAQVRVGDVLASTQSDTFVPDVPIGRITRVLSEASSLTRVAEVEPFVDGGSVDLVGVVIEPARTGTRSPLPRRAQ